LKILVYVLKRIVKFKKYVLVNKIKVILVNGTIKEMVNLMWTHLKTNRHPKRKYL
jgi:hypothetical protein